MNKELEEFLRSKRINSENRVQYALNEYKIAQARHDGYIEALDECTKVIAALEEQIKQPIGSDTFAVKNEIHIPKEPYKHDICSNDTMDIRKQ